MRTRLKRLTSLFLALVMVFTLIPPVALAAGVNDSLVSSLAALYDGDEVRAREELEALYEAGIIDENGNLVELDVREDGESVELAALAQRISAGETVGAITVNGHAATPEQIVQISRVGDLLELLRALEEDVEITDEHVANLEALLAGIADGSIDLSSAIERGSLILATSGDEQETENTVVSTGNVDAAEGKYTQPMLDGSDYDAEYQFALLDSTNTAYYVDSRYNGVTLDGTVTLSCTTDSVKPNDTVIVTATLDKPQPLPVSFDWSARGAGLDYNTYTVKTGGTVTWAVGESGAKSFSVKVPYKGSTEVYFPESDEARLKRIASLWAGYRAFVINVGNLQNAVFADDDSDTATPPPTAWSKTVLVKGGDKDKSYIEGTYGMEEIPLGPFTKVDVLNGSQYSVEMQAIPDKFPFVISITKPIGSAFYAGYFSTHKHTGGEGYGVDTYSYINNKFQEVTDQKATIEVQSTDYGCKILDKCKQESISPYLVLLPRGSGSTSEWNSETVEIKVGYWTPPVNVAVKSITVPDGTYYSGMTVPVTVEFDEFVAAKAGTTLTVNEVECPLLDSVDTQTRRLTFGYTVKDEDTGALNVTALTGVKNAIDVEVNVGTSFEAITDKSFGADEGVSLISNVKRNSLNGAAAKYGVSKTGAQTVTVMLPLIAGKRDWVASEAVQFESPISMPLPGHPAAASAGYLPGAYFSCDRGQTRYPVYVVEDGSDAFLVGRFIPPANESSDLRYDTLNLFLAIEALNKNTPADVTKYLPALSEVTDEGYDKENYADAPVVAGLNWSYYIKGGVRFEASETMDRPDYNAETDLYDETYNTLKLDDDRYVLLSNGQNPAKQHDVEVVVNEAFIKAIQNGVRTEDTSDLTLGYQCSSRKNFSFTSPSDFAWESSDETVARITMGADGLGHISFTGKTGTVTFTLTVQNGGKPFTLATRTLGVAEGKTPFLNIPRYSQTVPTLTNTDTDVLFASNATARNAAVGKGTTFTAKLYKVSAVNAAPSGDPVWTGNFSSPDENNRTVTHITVPGAQLSTAGVYALEIGTRYEGGTEGGMVTAALDLSATAYLTVKQAPAKVTLDKLDSYYVTSNQIPTIGYTVTPASAEVKYTVQKSGEAVSERTAPTTAGTIPFTADDLGEINGLKAAYTITVYARNSGDEAWSVDSLLLTVYNKEKLDIIISDVVAGAIGGTTGGAGTVADDTIVAMGNSGKLAGYGVKGDAYQLTFDDFNALRTDMSLQKIISANYGSGVWGLLSDKMKWASSNPDMVSVEYKQGGIYSDIRNYDYVYYAPDTDFLLAGKGETAANEKVTITATHANTGMSASFDVTTQTLDNELYMFQFLPKAETEVVYTNGSGARRELKSNAQGELAVYEPSGITSTVMAKSVKGGVTYVGTLYPEDLVSGERDIGALQLYPCNTVKLRAIGNAVLTFSNPDGSPYTGSVTIRAGVYKNGEYCPDALVRDVNGVTVNQSGRQDYTADLSATNGKLTVGFDPDQFKNASKNDVLQPGDKVSYVIEYRFGDGAAYRPGYARLNVASDYKADVKAADSLIQLYAVSGSKEQPQIFRQVMQQYYGETPTGYTRDVIGYTESIGVSPRFSKTELFTTLSLPSEAVTVENGYATYTATDDFGITLHIASSGKQLTGQKGTTVSKDTQAVQILELSALNSATLFVFPFSTMPMMQSVYTMTDANLSQDGVTDLGDTPSVRVKAQIARGGLTIGSDTLPFGVSNVTHQKDLSQPNGGAAEIAAEVKTDLTKRMDIGSAFQSVNVNEMLQQGFAFLGNLSGVAGSNQMFNMIIIPTEDPAVFRIAVLVGGKELENEDSEDGVSVNYDPNTLAEDIHEFEKALSDDDDDSNGEGKIEFSFSGALYLTAKCDIAHNKWDVAFTGGSVGAGVKGEYKWSQNFLCGPIPFFVEFKVGFGAEIEVSFVSKAEVRAMLLDTTLSLSLEAFAGLGFDLSLVAFKLGIFGRIGAAVNFQYLTQTGKSDMNGTKLSIDGEIGIKMEVKILLISYKKTFASTRFGWSQKYGSYDAIEREWENNGVAFLTGVTESGRAYAMRLFADGTALVAIEGGGEIENRDYLELANRTWNNGTPSGRRLLKASGSLTNTLTDVQTNAYPYSNPVLTDDGGMFLYISDHDNADELQSVVSYATWNGSGYDEGKTLYNTESATLADSDVVASGSGDNAFAAWVKQNESPDKEMHDETTYDDLGMMMNATEVYAGVYHGSAWTTTPLTNNNVADMAPTVASSGNRAIVAWRSLAAAELPADNDETADIAASFNVENNINYRIYDGTEWKPVQVAYNGSVGTVNAIDSAMLSDGTALLVYTVRTGEEATDTETFYTLVGSDGAVKTTGRLTNDSNTDTNAQVTAVGKQFIVGWYTEYDNGEATHDIRLARVNANGSVDETFPESIGSADINTSFSFSAPANNSDLSKLSIVWPETGDEALKAVRFYQDGTAIGVTAATDVATIPAHFTVDQFDAYTGTDGTVHTLILGSDYSGITGISAYDTINLEDLPVENTNGTDYLTILEQTPVAHIKLGSGSFAENEIEAEADFDLAEVTPGLTLPVRFTVRNTGTATLDSVTVKVDNQTKTFSGLGLLPNESAQLTLLYEVPESVTDDPAYEVTASGAKAEGWLLLNRPDVGIADMKLLREGDGTRDIQVRLENDSNIPLSGNNQTVKLAFYKDREFTKLLGEAYEVPTKSYADIDEGLYTYKATLSVRDLIGDSAKEIPEEGVTVYAKAWLEHDGSEFEYDPSNNSASLFFNGLLTKYKEAATIDTTLLTDGTGGYTVQADIRNNSMQDTDVGTLAALLLDDEGNVIVQKSFQDESLSLTTEQSKRLSVTFAANDLNGKTPAEAVAGTAYTVTFDVNGGTGAFDPAQTNLNGHITLPVAKPTPPTGMFFSGWYTQTTGGEQVTAETVFTENTTVYAQYIDHQHRFDYSAEGTTITATCSANDCYLTDHKATLTLSAPVGEIVYDGNAHPVTITDDNGIQGDAKVLYAVKGEGESYGDAVETAPVDAGTYKASITLGTGEGAKTASVEYTIENAALTNVSVSQNGTLTYNGSAQTPQVTTSATAVNNQTVTFTYSTTEGGTYGDMPTFTNVADGGTVYYKASAPNHDTASGSFTVTMNKANQSAPVAPTKKSATVDSITLTAVDGCEYRMGTDGTWQGSPTFTELYMNTAYTFYQRLKEDANHNASPASASATISTSNHAHEWSYEASGTTITATCGNNDGGHGTPLTSTLTIAAPTSLTYDGTAKAATVTGSIDGVETPTVSYKQGSTVLDAAPTDAGAYTASITLGDATASVTYTIAKATWGSTTESSGDDKAAKITGMTNYKYGQEEALPTPGVTEELGSTAGAQTAFYYSTSATAETGTVWENMTATTLKPGPYYLWAVTTSTNYTDTATPRKGCVFVVGKGTQAAPTIGSIIENVVTIGSYDATKTYEYAVAKTSGEPGEYTVAKPDEDGKFTLYGLTGGQTYYLNLRVKATANGLYDASNAVQQSFIAANIVSVVYDANGGSGTVPAAQTGADIRAASGRGLSLTGYTFQGWSTDKSAAEASFQQGDAVAQSCTLYAVWKGNEYTVKFNANGVTGTMEDESFTYGEEKALTANSFTRDGYTFVGWATTAGGTMRYTNQQSVKNLATSGSVTLYAVWAENTYTVKVTVKQTVEAETTVNANGATVKLMRGDAKVQEKTSGSDGVYTFTEIPAGTYHLVVTNVYDGKTRTVTEMVTVTPPDEGNTVTLNDVILPFAEVSAEVKVTGTDTPAVMVSGLNSEAETRAEDNKNVVMTMAIEEQDESSLTGTPEKQAETQTAIDAIKDNGEASGKTLSFLNIDVTKTTYATGTSTSPESEIPITETNNVIRINIPYDFAGKTNVRPFRYHDGTVTPMVQGSENDGGYKLDEANGLITLFTKQFSTYAIGYTEATVPGGSGGSGGGAGAAQPTVNKTANGTVSIHPTSPKAGEKVTITAKPDEGYAVDTVSVTDANGKAVSVTKVSDTTYTYTQPNSKVKIDVTFKAVSKTDALARFVDVSASDWYADAVRWAVDNGVMNGWANPLDAGMLFGPNDTTTRAMVATMLWRLEGSPVASGEMKFVDVADGTWYTEAIRWASGADIITGSKIPAKTTPWPMGFRPDDAVTREQLAAMLYRYAQYKKRDVSASASLSSYGDAASVSSWATSAMQWAVGSGIVNGIGSDLVPAGKATRAQVATMLMRYSTEK